MSEPQVASWRVGEGDAANGARVPAWVFAATVALMAVVSVPLGANRERYWGFLAAVAFVLLTLLAAGIGAGRWRAARGVLESGYVRAWLALLALWLATGLLPLALPMLVDAGDRGVIGKSMLLQGFYAAVALLVLLAAASPRRLVALAAVIFAAGVAQAVYGSFMTLSGAEWGFLERKHVGLGLATGTFVNRNHLAGYLELSGALGMGLLVAQLGGAWGVGWRGRLRESLRLLMGPKTWLRLALVALVIGLVLTQSRGGNVAFFAALGLIGIFALVALRPLPRTLAVLLVSVVLVDLLVIGGRFGVERVAERLRETKLDSSQGHPADADRLAVTLAAFELRHDHPWFGAGAGGFATAFVNAKPEGIAPFYEHAHNDWVETLVERGWIGLAIWVGLLAVPLAAALGAMRRRRDTRLRGLAFGAAMAVVALGIHGFVDFNWQIPANAATLFAVLAIALACHALPGRRAARSGDERGSAEGIRG